MKAAIYLRVSTQDQSLDLQRSELKRFVKARGWKLHKVYEDKATGSNANRPQLKDMMSDAHLREFDVVLVWKLDRLARSLKDLLTIIQTFEELGIGFVAIKDAIDLTTSSGRLMLAIIGAFAQFERDIIRERVLSGLAAAKRKGIRLGRPEEINSTSVVQLRNQGLSLQMIANKLGCSKAGVFKILKNQSLVPINLR